jgi:hypothetical protein
VNHAGWSWCESVTAIRICWRFPSANSLRRWRSTTAHSCSSGSEGPLGSGSAGGEQVCSLDRTESEKRCCCVLVIEIEDEMQACRARAAIVLFVGDGIGAKDPTTRPNAGAAHECPTNVFVETTLCAPSPTDPLRSPPTAGPSAFTGDEIGVLIRIRRLCGGGGRTNEHGGGREGRGHQ